MSTNIAVASFILILVPFQDKTSSNFLQQLAFDNCTAELTVVCNNINATHKQVQNSIIRTFILIRTALFPSTFTGEKYHGVLEVFYQDF